MSQLAVFNGRSPKVAGRLPIGAALWLCAALQYGAYAEPPPARTFHVDALAGDDGRDGMAPATAWRTLDRVNGASVQPGDSILFRRGHTWRGQLLSQSGAPGRPVTYGAYGQGPKPILLGSVAMNSPRDWQNVGAGVWGTISARFENTIPLSVDVGNVIFDGGRVCGTKKWREEDLAADLDYLYDARGWRVLMRSASNPASRFKSIELALRKHIISQSGKSFIDYDNLDLRYGAAHGIGGGGTRGITVRDCDISWIGGGHQFTRPDGKPVRFGNGVEFWAGAKDCIVERCRIWEIYDAALTNQGKGTNVQENIVYRNNVIWNSEYSFEYWNGGDQSVTKGIRFEHNTCVDAGLGWGHNQRPDRNGRHLMFYNNPAETSDFVIRYNIFANATESMLRLHGRDWTASLSMDHNVWHQPAGPVFLWGTSVIEAARAPAFLGEKGLGKGDVYADPGFVAPATREYRLRGDSPLRASAANGQPIGALP